MKTDRARKILDDLEHNLKISHAPKNKIMAKEVALASLYEMVVKKKYEDIGGSFEEGWNEAVRAIAALFKGKGVGDER